jgi:hypothetical protein
MKPPKYKNCYTCAVNSFEELFTEYKRRVCLSRLYLVLSFMLFASAIIFSYISIVIGAVLLIISFFSFLVSKRHLYVASIAERFFINKH